MLPLDAQIESLLFWKGEPVSLKVICDNLDVKEKEVLEALEVLRTKLSGRGMQLTVYENNVVLTTHPQMSSKIESLKKEELTKDLSKAALETLTIVLYRGPVKRSEIDFIRGVNSGFILRNLLVRGLINKRKDQKDERINVYTVSIDLLNYLGINRIEDLPEYDKSREEIEKFESEQKDVSPEIAPEGFEDENVSDSLKSNEIKEEQEKNV